MNLRLTCFAIAMAASSGCSRTPTPAASPALPSVEPQPIAATTAPTAWPDAATCAAASQVADVEPEIDAALRTIVGGMHSPDHAGPAAYDAVEAQARREPDRFLDAFARAALASGADVDLQWDSALTRAAELRPERSRLLAACLVEKIDRAMAAPPSGRDESWAQRVGDTRLGAYLVWRARPDDGTWQVVLDASVCIDDRRGHPTLRIEAPCMCGETITCDVARAGDRSDVLVRFDRATGRACDECKPQTGSCELDAADLRAMAVHGRLFARARCV